MISTRFTLSALMFSLIFSFGCSKDDDDDSSNDGQQSETGTPDDSSLQLSYDFTTGQAQDWQAVFRHIPKEIHDKVQLLVQNGEDLGPVGPEVRGEINSLPAEDHWLINFGIHPLPPELQTEGTGFVVQGNNHSDDMLMYLIRRIGPEDGLSPQTVYTVSIEAEVASNGKNCFGIGGSPGGLTFEMGASAKDPTRPVIVDGNVVFPAGIRTKTFFTESTTDNGNECSMDEVPQFKLIQRTSHTANYKSNANGELWLMVGTHSGFEGFSALYYTRINAVLTPVENDQRPPSISSP